MARSRSAVLGVLIVFGTAVGNIGCRGAAAVFLDLPEESDVRPSKLSLTTAPLHCSPKTLSETSIGLPPSKTASSIPSGIGRVESRAGT